MFTLRRGRPLANASSEAVALRADDVLNEARRLLMKRDLVGAGAAFTVAAMHGADADACGGGRWEVAMLRGDMEAAWRETDLIRARAKPDPHRFWDGETLAGKKVVIRCLHGFGDTIQMLPYVAMVLEIAKVVVLEVQPELLALVRSLSLARTERLQVITWGAEQPSIPPAWETQVEAIELPYIFRTLSWDLPLARSYLELPAADVAAMDGRMGGRTRPRVGLVWSAGEWNPHRAVDPAMFGRLLHLPMEFWSLVHSRHWPEAVASGIAGKLRDAAEMGVGVLAMAEVIANLDLLITTDTLAAHLAGAMGVRVWVLLPFAADWRWMDGREDSPWYPTMRLLRQPAPGDWEAVLARVDEMLRAGEDL